MGIQTIQNPTDRHLFVVAMEPVEVDAVGLQAPEALRQFLFDDGFEVLFRQLVLGPVSALRREDQVGPVPPLGHPVADYNLAGAIEAGGVDDISADGDVAIKEFKPELRIIGTEADGTKDKVRNGDRDVGNRGNGKVGHQSLQKGGPRKWERRPGQHQERPRSRVPSLECYTSGARERRRRSRSQV